MSRADKAALVCSPDAVSSARDAFGMPVRSVITLTSELHEFKHFKFVLVAAFAS